MRSDKQIKQLKSVNGRHAEKQARPDAQALLDNLKWQKHVCVCVHNYVCLKLAYR